MKEDLKKKKRKTRVYVFILETYDMTKDRNSESRKEVSFQQTDCQAHLSLPGSCTWLLISHALWTEFPQPVSVAMINLFGFFDPNVISKFETQCTSIFLRAVVCSIAEPLSSPYSSTERKTLLTLLNLIMTHLLNGLLPQCNLLGFH